MAEDKSGPVPNLAADEIELLESLKNELVFEYEQASPERREKLDRYLKALEIAMTLAELKWLLK